MRKNAALFAILVAVAIMGLAGAPARAEKTISDGSGRPSALAILGYDPASGTTRMVAVDPVSRAMYVMLSGATGTVFVASGSIAISTGTVAILLESSYESIDQAVAPATCLDISPAATSSYFLFTTSATWTLMLSNDPGAPATLASGSYCSGRCAWSEHGIETAYMNVCNTNAGSTASVNIRYARY
jgi:hypothetical protein